MLYVKLAFRNLKKNKKIYMPFFLAGMISFVIYFLIYTIGKNDSMASMISSELFDQILTMGISISGIIIAIFLFLANSYLLKTKKKILGVFNTLGMSKKHLIILTFWEMCFVAVGVISIGLVLGNILSSTMFGIIAKILKSEQTLVWHFSFEVNIKVILLFIVLYAIIFVGNAYVLVKTKSINLLKGEQLGETEPSSFKIKAIMGLVLLIGGYYVASTTVSPIQAANRIFFAVFLIVSGIYMVFVYSSIAFLKKMKQFERIFLKIPNFICISNLLHRMKKNAVGMACICLLGTAVITISSATVSLYVGLKEQVKAQYVTEIMLSMSTISVQDIDKINEMIKNYSNKNNGIQEKLDLATYVADCKITDNTIENNSSVSFVDRDYGVVHFVDMESYNSLIDKEITLEKNQIMIFTNDANFDYKNVSINGVEYEVVEYLENMPIYDTEDFQIAKSYYIIGNNPLITKPNNLNEKKDKNCSTLSYICGMEVDESFDKEKFVETINSYMNEQEIRGDASYREKTYEWQLAMYSGFLFVGIAFSLLFIVMMAFVIYYKQISEGYEDQYKFKVMKNIGVTEKDIKKITRQQVLFAFFVPLVFSLINMCFAYKIIVKFLMLLNLRNISLFFICTLITATIFIAVYGGIYALTTKQYTNIVINKD
jgi:putative ABC transport system permease protein